MVKSHQHGPENQRLLGRVPTEPKDASGIPLRIDLDDLYGGEHYAKKILAVLPRGVVLFVGRLASQFHVIDATSLVTVEPHLPDAGFRKGRAGELKSGEVRRCLEISIRRDRHNIEV
jgi:hypothetical protein